MVSGNAMNKHLLKHTLTPIEYETLTKDIIFPAPVYRDYWKNMPDYLLARCPICGAPYHGQLDTYSLKYWVRPEHGTSIFFEDAQKIECGHFVRTHHFINLNGIQPIEFKRQKNFGYDVPYVHPFWLANDIQSYAVMHALPICRPANVRFEPLYMLYVITYYSADPNEMLQRRWQAAKAWSTLLAPQQFPNREIIFDLVYWVRAGKLQWVSSQDPKLSLLSGPVEAFPYTGLRSGNTGTFSH